MSAAPEQAIGDILKKSWDVFMKDPVLHIIASLLLMIVSAVSLGILAAPLTVGYIRLIRDRLAGHAVSATDIFAGLSTTITALITMILLGIIVAVGSILLILPGIAAAVLLSYAFHFIAYNDAGIMDSLSQSFALVKDNIVLVIILIVILAILNSIGSTVVIGTLLTMPFSMIVTTVAFESMTGQSR